MPALPSFLLVAFFLVIGSQVHAEELKDILNQISSDLETKKAPDAESAAASQPVKIPAREEPRNPAEPRPQPSKAKEIETAVEPRKIPAPSERRIVVFRPKDKLPKDIAGCGVAGDFLLTGEDALGGARIISADDALNPFARSFIIKNLTSGYSPGTFLTSASQRAITVSPGKPLIFIGRGMLPGEYLVRSQD